MLPQDQVDHTTTAHAHDNFEQIRAEPSVHTSQILEGGEQIVTDKGEAKSDEKKVPPMTEEEKQKKDPVYQAKVRQQAKELLTRYLTKFKCLMGLGLLFNLLGMVGEFASPLFIGLVIDAIVKGDFDEVKYLTIMWMVINTAGAFFAGI